jgi:hypothetical protein
MIVEGTITSIECNTWIDPSTNKISYYLDFKMKKDKVRIPLKNPYEDWITNSYGDIQPKPRSTAWYFIKSLDDLKIRYDLMCCEFQPELLFKKAKFSGVEKTFKKNGKEIKYIVWTLDEVGNVDYTAQSNAKTYEIINEYDDEDPYDVTGEVIEENDWSW